MTALPTYADVEGAAGRLAGVAHRTPVFTSRTVNAQVHADVYFKGEHLQRAGAFKFRGAYNALARLGSVERKRGVATYSSGNHAQAIALAGQLLEIPRVVVMPVSAPAVKQAATRAYGAEVVLYDPAHERREVLGQRLAAERGLSLIPPFDHPDVIAGQGTAARELLQEVGPLDLLLVPCGGGGLLAGSALSARALAPACRVVGVEPLAGDDATRSFRTRTLHTVRDPDTVADGARTPSLGELTFPLVLGLVSEMVTIEDRALLDAMFFLWERMKLLAEPTGALGAAALLAGLVPHSAGARIGIIISGGNVDLSQVQRWRDLL